MEWPHTATRLGVLVLLTTLFVDAVRRLVHKKRKYSLPPGPLSLPLLGSILSINPNAPWLTYMAWREKYGDIMYLRILDSDVVVLNSPEAATELLGKRSHIYSDRPFVATIEPYGHGLNFAFTRYGEHWRLCRRIFHQSFRADASLAYRPMQLRKARKMITSIIDDPEEYPLHYSTFSTSIALSSVYDYEPKPRDDPVVSAFEKFLTISFAAITPEKATLLKAFPILLSIPDWLPWSHVKREAEQAMKYRQRTIDLSFDRVKKRMESKEHINDSMVFDHLTRMGGLDDEYRAGYEAALVGASTTAFIGAAETTSTTIMIFTLAMVQNPRVWKRAQAEIDALIGKNKLPEFEDRGSLPYIDAIIRETFRWKPLIPLGVAHANLQSDIINGFYIPKGATVIPNVWGMFHDSARYPNPEVFCPERFLDAQGLLIKDNPGELLFGFGRRSCPGKHIADASIWSAVATMLATLDFNAAKDKDGKDKVYEVVWSSGLIYRPNLFPCCLTPRAHVTKERVLAK